MLCRACHIIFILICLVFNSSVNAQENCPIGVYQVADIHLDETAATGTLAREQAIALASDAAFDILLQRLLVSDQPNTSLVKELDSADFIEFIHIDDENALAQRYIANIDICFDGTRMRAEFIKHGLKWSELRIPPILFLPVWQEPAGVRVWAKNVLWLDGWHQLRQQKDRLLEFTFLEPDLSLERQLSAEKILEKDPEQLKLAAKASDVQQIALLYAGLDYSQTPALLQISAQLYDAEGRFLSDILNRQITMNGQTSLSVAFDLFQQDVVSAIETAWRQTNLYVVDDKNEIFVSVLINSPETWYHIIDLLARLPVVTSANIHSLSAEKGTIRLQLSASIEALQMAVRASGYSLDRQENSYMLSVYAR